MEWLKPLRIWRWVSLQVVPQWEEIQMSLDELIEKEIIEREMEKEIYAEYCHIKSIVGGNITIWNEKRVKCEERWINIFELMLSKDLPFKHFAILIEYSFAIPGSN